MTQKTARPAQTALLAYAVALSVWSGSICEAQGGLWFIGVVPVLGWGVTVISYNLWATSFALLAALWVACVGAVLVLRWKPRGAG